MGAARKIMVADLFCGAGGTSRGLAEACLELDVACELLAINHWQTAIATHTANHPWARHLCANVENVDPRQVVPGGRLDLLVASPECIWHSTARGGRPINDQARSTAWRVLEWCEKLYVSNLLVENVPEFGGWGPLNVDGRPNKARKGDIFRAFITSLEAMNYKVEFKVLSAADFGGATTRRRLFILARKKGKRIVWPAQTHAKEVKSEDIFLNLKPWRTAREIIDWKNRGHSIFGRKKPLAASTIDRIAAGIRRFCHPQLIQPFLVMLYGTNDVRSVDLPAPTVTAEGQHIALAQPFILAPLGIGRGNAPRSVDQPTPTILATRGGGHIVEPFIITPGGADLGVGRPVSSPLPTVTGSDRFAVVDPFIIPFYGEREGQEARKHGVDEPLPTQPCSNKFGLAKPFVLQQQSGGAPRATDQPLPTIVGKGAQELVQPFITDVRHADQRIHSPDAPLPTLTGKAGHAIVEPYLVKYNSSGDGKDPHSVDKPIGTITARDRFALVTPDGRYELDIYFRMLTVAELAAAMGFKDYKFTGTKSDQVRQIGNAVEVNMAKALIKKLLI